MFSCEFCEIFKNTFFAQHLRTTGSEKAQESAYTAVFNSINAARRWFSPRDHSFSKYAKFSGNLTFLTS